ncbi:hypothetical protein KUV62_07340 [Salipiger bermudensis]|uniref:hypothetical protein n=1 Tax=Salipiger bermudensis TaxID=344736 RepID=UPI001C991D97|nr:hypothetical protein [Salipiger bermudensis]MBY6003714.1 hypothetical protein [Salipiger bermudensis]
MTSKRRRGGPLPAPHQLPKPSDLERWRVAAHTGAGSPWLPVDLAEALVRYGLYHGEGLRMMEAASLMLHEPPRDVAWEIIGADSPGENWDDHQDPERAFRLFRAKLRRAQAEGARLQYKIWLGRRSG